jgi:hypothetical protein
LVFLWFPIVMYICFKILFCKKDMNWGKTTHGLVLEEEMNLQSAKSEVQSV